MLPAKPEIFTIWPFTEVCQSLLMVVNFCH